MKIALTTSDIDAALPKLMKGLGQYLWLQEQLNVRDARSDAEFRRRFNAFYRGRRGRAWQDAFYDLLERTKRRPASFADILEALRAATGRLEASFASKLLATVDPAQPVIDSVVLKNLGLRLPAHGAARRAERIVELHAALSAAFAAFLATADGRRLVARFRSAYPDAHVTETKMLDLVLWQTRPERAVRGF